MVYPPNDAPAAQEEYRLSDAGMWLVGNRVLHDGEAENDAPADDDADDGINAPVDDATRQQLTDLLGFDPTHTDSTTDDGLIRAAGLLLINHGDYGDAVLFVRHADRGTWEFPGGTIEPGESAEDAAKREVFEEIGATPYGRVSLLMRDRLGGVDYSTFIARAAAKIEPSLSDELTDWQWAPPNAPPEPLHPGVRIALSRLGMNELDLARAIADGRMASPQQYENLWLFALRITGTGASYRPELEEHVWRDPALYLNNDFLERCNGLPVIWQHPPGDELNQTEFEDRVIGAIMLPYIEGDEVWGVAKIFDQDAAQMMLDVPLSTSPAVVFRDPSANEVRKLADGKTLLIEGEPSLVDHLAICELGVWDKGGQPTGVARGEPEMAEADLDEIEIDENPTRADAVRSRFEQMTTRFDRMCAVFERMADRITRRS